MLKRLVKAIAALAGAAVVFDTVNKAVFSLAKKRAAAPREGERVYKWKYGRVRYIVRGDDSLPPLLLVHGIATGADRHEWDAVIPALSKRYRVFALDLPGFGRSEAPNVTVSSYLYTALLRDFMKQVISDSTFVVANNLSCSFAAAAALLSPNCVEKLLLLAPYAVTQQRKPSYKQRLIKLLLECPVFGTSLYLAMTSRCFLHDRKQYSSAHSSGASSRFLLASKFSGGLYADTASIFQKLNTPYRTIWAESTERFPQAAHPQKLYDICKEFFRD